MPDETKFNMLSSVEMDVLQDLLLHGDNTPKNIGKNTDRNPSNVSARLSDLQEKGLVKSKGGGVWTLTLRGANMARSIHDHRQEDGDGEGLNF